MLLCNKLRAAPQAGSTKILSSLLKFKHASTASLSVQTRDSVLQLVFRVAGVTAKAPRVDAIVSILSKVTTFFAFFAAAKDAALIMIMMKIMMMTMMIYNNYPSVSKANIFVLFCQLYFSIPC